MKKKILSWLLACAMVTSMAASSGMVAYAADIAGTAYASRAVTEWNSGTVYTGGDQVSYNGGIFEARYWTQGNAPTDSAWGPWKLVSGGGEVTTSPIDTTAPATSAPTTTAPVPGGVSEWNSSTVYMGGDKVSYNGGIFEARYWTQGNAPTDSDWGPWKKVGGSVEETTTAPATTAPVTTAPIITTKPIVTTAPIITTKPVDTTAPIITTTAPIETTTPANNAPVINGVVSKTIKVGDKFDAKAGVTATDVEDGDLTAAISISGKVDTATAGTYTLIYTVADKAGLIATATAVITVKAPLPEGEYSQTSNINGVKYPDGYWDRKVVGYFPNYAINSENHAYFTITDLQWDKLTHVQYAFVIADENTFEMVPSDPENDVNSKFEGRKFYHKGKEIKMDDTLGYYGQFNLMHTMKEMYPDVTVLASTGGWAASRSLWKVTDSEANMNKFADSAVAFVRKYGFDGIDIDFEFPSETSQSGNPADFDLSEPRRAGISDRYAKLIEILRNKFDQAAKEDGRYYWVTSAVSASSWVLGGQTNASYLDLLDFVSVMSYDYHGGWNQFVENQANIYPDPADTETKSMALPTLGFEWSKNYYRGEVQSEKILMGIPYYTRGWTNVNGGNNGLHGSSKTPATGIDNIWHDLDENGNEIPAGANPLWHVLNLMNAKDSNYKKYWDPVGCVPYVWNDVTRTFLTFEDEQSIQERINYIDENNLGGCLIWVMHGDYDYDAVNNKYVVGDTLTTKLYDSFKKMGPAKLTSDIKITDDVLDFDVEFGGKYDHPNYTYAITVKNNTGVDFDKWTISFDIPKSAMFGSSWGGQATVTESENDGFWTVTLAPGWEKLPNGGSATLQGMIKLNFASVKNFKLNGKAQKSEVEAEIARLYR